MAPHGELELRTVTVESEDVVEKARSGDILRVMRNVGGGGGHRLIVKDFKMTIVHKRPSLATESDPDGSQLDDL